MKTLSINKDLYEYDPYYLDYYSVWFIFQQRVLLLGRDHFHERAVPE